MMHNKNQEGPNSAMIHESGENYLKAILVLQRRNGFVRSLDVARMLKVTKPSVSNALKRLHNRGYLDMKEDKLIALTELGQKTAEQVYEKHSVIKACLIRMGVDADIADKDACQMEHVVSQETLKRMQAFVGGENCY